MHFNVLSFTSLVLAAASSASALVVPRSTPPAGWITDYLEPYTTYHTRYIAIGCQNQHGKPFFDQCCHPLLATEKLETARPPQCIPSASASSSASAVEPTSTVKTPADGNDDGCDEDGNDPSDQSSSSSVAAPTQSPPSNDDSHKPAAAAAAAPAPTTSTATKEPPVTPKSDKKTGDKADKKTDNKPPPSDASPASTSSDLIKGGFATFFFQNGVAGACGTVHKDSDMIAAMNVARYGDTGVHSSLCGKHVKITNPANQKSVTVIVADACPGCKNSNSIDLSTGAFNQIAKPEEGMVPIEWAFV